jgi:hypothetical protein
MSEILLCIFTPIVEWLYVTLVKYLLQGHISAYKSSAFQNSVHQIYMTWLIFLITCGSFDLFFMITINLNLQFSFELHTVTHDIPLTRVLSLE